jgi:hypothetical protein
MAQAETQSDPKARSAIMKSAWARLARALKAEPDRYDVLYAYARSRRGEPGYPSANDLDILLEAQDIAPQVRSIRWETAMALKARGNEAGAIKLLQPLASDPHGGETAAAARKMIEEARGGARAGVPKVGAAPAATAASR